MSLQSNSIQLRKRATLLMLWGLGVGAVISGDFFGWQYGLQQGGFVGMLLALLLVLAMYTCLIFSIAELSAAMPNAGGFYLFAKQAFGHFAGYFCGILVCIEYIITAAIIVVGISHYMHLLFPAIPVYLWWVGFYVIFAGVNIIGVGMTLELMVLITCISIAILVFFYASVLGTHAFHWRNLLNVTPSAGFTHWLPHGLLGALTAIPNAIWLFLAIEELPMAAEETRNAARVLPKALLVCLITLALLALLTLFLNSGVGGGAAVMGHSDAPLYAGFLSVLHHRAWMPWLNCFMLIGLITSFNGIIFGFGRTWYDILEHTERLNHITSGNWLESLKQNCKHYPRECIVIGVAALAEMMIVDSAATQIAQGLYGTGVNANRFTYLLQIPCCIVIFVSFILLEGRELLREIKYVSHHPEAKQQRKWIRYPIKALSMAFMLMLGGGRLSLGVTEIWHILRFYVARGAESASITLPNSFLEAFSFIPAIAMAFAMAFAFAILNVKPLTQFSELKSRLYSLYLLLRIEYSTTSTRRKWLLKILAFMGRQSINVSSILSMSLGLTLGM